MAAYHEEQMSPLVMLVLFQTWRDARMALRIFSCKGLTIWRHILPVFPTAREGRALFSGHTPNGGATSLSGGCPTRPPSQFLSNEGKKHNFRRIICTKCCFVSSSWPYPNGPEEKGSQACWSPPPANSQHPLRAAAAAWDFFIFMNLNSLKVLRHKMINSRFFGISLCVVFTGYS